MTPPKEEPRASNVIEALRRVMEELPNIGKSGKASEQQGGYGYRKIDDITQAVQPLFAKHGIVFVPHVQTMEVRELTVNNRPWTDTTLRVRYEIFGPGGPDDLIDVEVVGIGRDNSDKGANKAMTQAFKYALTQTFCIADPADDGDAGSP